MSVWWLLSENKRQPDEFSSGGKDHQISMCDFVYVWLVFWDTKCHLNFNFFSYQLGGFIKFFKNMYGAKAFDISFEFWMS